uniref:RNA polymerase II elongation factor ELL N-terminal domain-containing protein n=1 Tax=Lates calcarifer TaxID=8187 RepID=A0A4W6E7X4_LATCA
MSALRENQCYGLSSGKLNRGGNISVFHVKLTDSAARAIADTELRPVFMYSIARGRQMEKPRQMDRLKNQTFDPVNHK